MKKLLFCIIIFIIGYILGNYVHKDEYKKLPLIHDTLYKDSIIRDSIYLKNDSINEEIKKLEKYDTLPDIILSNTDSANLQFFSKYIEDFNNKRTIKDN